MFQSVFFRRLFVPHLILICAAIAGVGLFAASRLHSSYMETRRLSLRSEARLVWDLIGADLRAGRVVAVNERLKPLGEEIGCRITVIAEDGLVLADNWADTAQMENHRTRPEIVEASRHAEGSSARPSATVHEGMLYVARQFGGEAQPVVYVRLAVRLRELGHELNLLYGAIGASALAAMALTAGISYQFARRQTAPILELTSLAEALTAGNLSRRTVATGKGEIGRLGAALNTMAASFQGLLMQMSKDRAELLTILTSMSEGVIATDAQQQILMVNKSAAMLLAFDAEAAHGKPLWQVVRIDDVIKAAARVLASRQTRIIEAGLIGGRYLEIRLSPSPTDGAPQGLVVVVHDMTQSMRYQELRKEFVANVSHELRTPLTVIKGYVETLRDGALRDPARAEQYLATIERHTNQLTNLVSDLLELSRLESQPDLPRRVSVDLVATIRKAIDLLAPAVAAKKQTLTPTIARLPLIVGNPDYLERAVANLIDNASKYTPEGGRIQVSASAANGAVTIEVADNGIGIPADDLPRIFERFYRVDRSRSRDMGGTGLGLSIVKHIAQAHGATVEVTSTPGQGSAFRFKLPVPQQTPDAVSRANGNVSN